MNDDKPFITHGNVINLPWSDVITAINYWFNEAVFKEPVRVDAIDIWLVTGVATEDAGLSIEISRVEED